MKDEYDFSKGVEITRLVNEMLRQDIKLIEAVK